MTPVTAIIPTRGRPALLRRAIDSVLAQDGVDVRVLVVIDGPADPESRAVVDGYSDQPVQALALSENRGPAYCRSHGAEAAETEWVAFLDDDDLWYPTKLARQMALADAIGGSDLIVSCRSDVVTPSGLYVWPRRLPRPGERVGDYLFCRRSLFKGESFVQASSILCPRALMLAHPQRPVAHEDWDWLLDCCERGSARLVIASEPLVRHYTEFKRASLSNQHQMQASIRWALAQRRTLSPRAYAGLMLQVVNGALVERGDWRQARRLLGIALNHGRPRLMDLSFFALQWLLPVSARRRLRRLMTGQGPDNRPPEQEQAQETPV